MAYAIGLYSTMRITDKDLGALMARLKAERTNYGWRLTRNGVSIEIEPAHHEIPDDIPEAKLRAVTNELGAPPRSKLVVLWTEETGEGLEARMARAVARAMSEQFTVVLDDNFGTIQGVRPASIAGES